MAYDINDPENSQYLTASPTSASTPKAPLTKFDPNAGPAPTIQDEGRGTDRFLNFSRIFNANAGASRQAANQLTDRIARQGKDVQTDLQTGQNTFEHDKTAGTTTFQDGTFIPPEVRDGDAGSIALGTPNTSSHGMSNGRVDLKSKKQGLSSGEGPPQITREEATRQSNAQYTGPMGWSDEKLQGRAMDAAEQAKGVGDFNQRQAMLGNSKLNSALTGASGGRNFVDLAQRFGGLGTQYNNQVANDAKEASDAQTVTKGAASRYGDLVKTFDTNADTQLQNDINNDPSRHIQADNIGGGEDFWNTANPILGGALSAINPAAGAVYKGIATGVNLNTAAEKKAYAQKEIAAGRPDPWTGNYGDGNTSSKPTGI